jgi:hypothetical protein
MRRLIAAGVGALVLATVAPASSASAAASAYADAQGGAVADATAAWIVLDHHGGGDFYYAEGVRQVWVPTGFESVGFVARGRCHSVHNKHVTFVVCTAFARPHPVSLDEFVIDPLLRTASLNLRLRGVNHRVRWVGRGSPGAGEQIGAGPGWIVAAAGVARSARATGTLFGHRVSGGHSMAYLAVSALGYAVASPGTHLTRTGRPDGSMLVRYRAVLR